MRIAVDCRMLGSGGIGSYLQALLPFFVQNNECLLIGNVKDISIYNANAKTSTEVCNIKPFSFKDTYNFPKEIAKEINKYDVFYSPYCNIPSGIKIPIYTTIHDVVFLDIPELAGTIGTIGRKFFYKRAMRLSKTVFTVSNFSKSRIENHLGTKKAPLIVTYNALPPWFNSITDKSNIKSDYILFVGNIKKHKGLHTLIEAYKKCLLKNFNTKLMIVGNADNFRTSDNSVSKEIETLKENVIFTGRITDEELKVIYSNAKLLIQPSLYEGFGMPPLEAISLGTNAIISDIPVFKEIYANLPVIYFKTEDSEDLAKKIMENIDLPSPKIIENPYSFERTYNIIMNEINS